MSRFGWYAVCGDVGHNQRRIPVLLIEAVNPDAQPQR
jgi:hypothetical protein